MKRLLPIIVLLILLASLIFNYIQFNQGKSQQAEIASLKSDKASLGMELEKANNAISEKEIELSDAMQAAQEQEKSITDLQENYRKLQSSSAVAQSKVNRIMCRSVIPFSDVQNISTNNALIEPITSATEKTYSFSSINTTFELIWDNDKAAIFSVTNQKQEVARSIVTWSSNKVKNIYDIGLGCFYYLS